ncbi:hypothetical protein BV898_13524 [Hypsibius exemplaris]|uniref:G-protein coupled receptors family 1 profile domain-containing protein n=1 Tax=Hypsibius exemplaris TaxID=2072580 RepID=A0A1W0WAI6_HYPEX|nr:hypothetical protein BV898_13524 [Hypsibius exemplaris]
MSLLLIHPDSVLVTSHEDQSANNSNNLTASLQQLSEARAVELHAWIIVAFSICFIGLFNNVLVLLVTWPRPGRRKPVGLHMVIFHFIAINLFMCLVNHHVRSGFVAAKTYGHILIPDSVCRYVHVFYNVGWIALSWAEAALAVNRIIAIFFPHQYREWTSKSVNLVMVALPWLIGFALVLPVSFGLVGGMTIQRLGQCGQIVTNEAFITR